MEPETSANPQSAMDPFVQAYNSYRQALERVISGSELQQRLSDTQCRAAQSSSEAVIPKEAQQQAADAYRNYIRAFTDATSLPDLERRTTDAVAGYQQVLQDHVSPQRVRERLMNVYADYARDLHEALAPEQVQEQVDAAYGDYVKALQDAWANVDPERLDLTSLGAITQVSAAGGWLRAASVATVRQRWLVAANLTALAVAARTSATS